MRRLDEAKYQYELEELEALGMELETRETRQEGGKSGFLVKTRSVNMNRDNWRLLTPPILDVFII